MPAATPSSAHSRSNGATRSHDHKQGNQDRKYTIEQKAEVVRVRRCSPNSFYDILGLEKVKKTVTDTEIKKAYRKISLLTHPDKNGYEHADEAFKMVSRAFGVLGDKEKKAKYDRFGGDPDSRSAGQQASSPFSRFSGAGEWQQELSPEEIFRRFFRGDLMGGIRAFDNGAGFVFNMGDGPGIRVNQFGGATPRRRPRDANAQERPAPTFNQTILSLLPIIIVFLIPFFTSIFTGSSSSASLPTMRFDSAIPPYTLHRSTQRLKLDYYINPLDVKGYTKPQLNSLDKKAEVSYLNRLNTECQQEELHQHDMFAKARGWFRVDVEKMAKAQNMPLHACKKLEEIGLRKSF